MPRIPLPFAPTLTRGRSSVAGMGGLVNAYAEPVRSEGRTGLAVYPMPGRVLFSTIGGSFRGTYDFAGYHVAVVDDRLYTVDSSGTATDRGEIEGVDRCDLDYNGAQLFVQGEIKSYTYVPSTSILAEITDSDFLGASSCCSLNGYTITTVPNSDRFQWFDLRDATSIDGLNFATAESNGDINIAARVANKDLHLFGEKTVEFFYNSGNPDQQFESKSIPPLEIGCISRDAIVLMDTGFNWVGRDGRSGGIGVYRMVGGYQAKKISTPAVDRYLEEYHESLRPTIHAQGFQFHAHQFYCLHLPGVVTLYYDQATDTWGFLKSGTYPITSDPLGGWDAIGFAVNNGKRIVGGSDGNLYELSGTTYTDNSAAMVREIITSQASFPQSDRGAIIHRIGADMEVGVGLATGQGSAPLVMAAISKNGGKTFRALGDRSIGAVGEYDTNVFWTRQGAANDLILKLRVTDPVPFNVFGAFADVEPLA